MNVSLRHHAWLLTGGVLAVVIVWSGAPLAPVRSADTAFRALAATAVAALGLALHFRSHASRLARHLQRQRQQEQERRRRLAALAEDLERSAHVVGDNLQEIIANPAGPAAQMYVEGAAAHVARLSDLGKRVRLLADGESP